MSDEVIPFDRWGKDHWSTLAYIETRIADRKGRLNVEHMRCDPRLHRAFTNRANIDSPGSYPTVLADGSKLDRHDDWSCAEDAIALGLLTMDDEEAVERGNHYDAPDEFLPGRSPKFSLTPRGLEVAALLRAHKASGGSFSTFRLESPAGVAPPRTSLPLTSGVSATSPAESENR